MATKFRPRWRVVKPEPDKVSALRKYQREYMRNYRLNPEVVAAERAAYHSQDLATRTARSAQYRASLSPEEKAKRNAVIARWATDHPEKTRAKDARYRAEKLQATPAWADHNLIDSFYRMAQVFGLEVDHIIPLQSKLVCGLHVQHNLQLLTREENRRKGNKLLSMDVAAPYGNGMEDERTCAAFGEQDALSISATT